LTDIFGISVDPSWRTYLEDVVASAEAVRKQG